MTTLAELLPDRFRDGSDDGPCGCEATFDGEELRVDASECDHGGRLASSPDCRETVVETLRDRDADTIVVRHSGLESRYVGVAAATLVAAGRFAEAVEERDSRLATRACRYPLSAAREATGRADAVADAAAEAGLTACADHEESLDCLLAPRVGLVASDWLVGTACPPSARLVETRSIDTGGTVREYRVGDSRRRYVLEPLEHTFEAAETETLAAAYERLAEGRVTGGRRAPGRAVRAVAPGDVSVEQVTRVLRKHTQGYGLLADLFADPSVSDVFLTAPADDNPVRVRVGDDVVPTNVRLTGDGLAALASRFRHESGRGFSRADPTLDAAITVGDRRVRVAGVTEPVAGSTAFAFRAHDDTVWTLPALVANDTLTAEAAALLSLAVERGRSLLVAGPRGAGKTTLLGALLWEIPPAVRTVIIEDTAELPVESLQESGRDVQTLRASVEDDDLSPAEALRTALRLGNGALALGEVRGEEARVLYEAMRVGANSEAVLGTIHGDGAAATYERVVSDLGVPPSSFTVTDLVVTLEVTPSASQSRRVHTIEEVCGETAESFESLYARPDGPLEASGRIERGNSSFVAALSDPGESYADVLATLEDRQSHVGELAATGRTDPDAVPTRRGGQR